MSNVHDISPHVTRISKGRVYKYAHKFYHQPYFFLFFVIKFRRFVYSGF